jgi:hypothetical protein
MESGLEEITEDELINSFIDARLNQLHKIAIGRVDSYDASKGTVSVTPMINRMLADGATPPNYVSEPLPALADVQVAHIRGGGFFVAVPLQPGDFGILLYCDRNHAAWRATGNRTDPGDLGLHTMSSALFVPAIAPDKQAIQNADANNLVVGSDSNGSSRIVIKPSGEIDAGASAAQFVAMANKVLTELNKIAATFNAASGHTHSFTGTGTVGPPNGGTLYTSASAVASTNLKAEG